MELRPYQWELIGKAREQLYLGSRNLLITAPTGCGKTAMAAEMIRLAKDKSFLCLFICHRRELIHQASREFTKCDIAHEMILPGIQPGNENVHIISVQLLARRLEYYKKFPRVFLVWDEGHHISSNSWARIKLAFPRSCHVGFTPVPERLDGKGLCHHFDTMIQGPSVRQLIELGYLSDYAVFAPAGPNLKGIRKIGGDYQKEPLAMAMNTLTGDIVAEYKKHAMGKQALIFAVTIKHSLAIAKAFKEAGFTCNHIDGETPKGERDRLVEDYANRKFPILTNCELFGEGFNVPGIECLIMARPTASMALYRQQVGRALRPAVNKERAIILDMAGNVHRHGAPCDEITWSLEGKKNRLLKRNPYRMCKSCYFMQAISKPKCEECGFEFPVNERLLPIHKEGELIEFNREELKKKRRLERLRATTLSDLIALGKRRGYKNPYFWGLAVLRGRNKNKR